jgi:hypothetical protein
MCCVRVVCVWLHDLGVGVSRVGWSSQLLSLSLCVSTAMTEYTTVMIRVIERQYKYVRTLQASRMQNNIDITRSHINSISKNVRNCTEQ